MKSQTRRKFVHIVLLLLTVCLGLASRHFAPALPPLLSKNAGDILYATMTFWLARLLFPRFDVAQAAGAALAFCVAIEFAKFLQMPWLVAIRHRTWGHLVFGSGFHASNLICYVLGILLGATVEAAFHVGDTRGRGQRP